MAQVYIPDEQQELIVALEDGDFPSCIKVMLNGLADEFVCQNEQQYNIVCEMLELLDKLGC